MTSSHGSTRVGPAGMPAGLISSGDAKRLLERAVVVLLKVHQHRARFVSTPSAIADTSTRTRLHSWQHGFTTMYRFGAVPSRICACSSAYSRSDAARSSACGVAADAGACGPRRRARQRALRLDRVVGGRPRLQRSAAVRRNCARAVAAGSARCSARAPRGAALDAAGDAAAAGASGDGSRMLSEPASEGVRNAVRQRSQSAWSVTARYSRCRPKR